MSVTSLNGNSPLNLYSNGSAAGVTGNGASGIGSDILAALGAGSGNALLASPSALVSLGGSTGSSSSGATYDAQGMLSMLQGNASLSDPLLQAGGGGDDVESAILQAGLAHLPGGSSTATFGTQGNTSGTDTTGSTDLTGNWVAMLQQNPALAGQVVQNQTAQSLIDLMA